MRRPQAGVRAALCAAHHPEYGFPDPTRVEIQRSVYGKLAWRY
ncbi:MAG: hypothetical protein WBF89_11420 [Steroidobacteraceae bacterium]